MGEETCYFCRNNQCPAAILRWGQKTRRAKVVLFILIFKLFPLLPKSTASKRPRQHRSNFQMLHESPVLTGHLIYGLGSLSQRTGWNLGFTVPDALLTEQMTLGSSHLISSSLSHPSWRLGENSLPATLSFLCVWTCTYAFILSAITKRMPGQSTE